MRRFRVISTITAVVLLGTAVGLLLGALRLSGDEFTSSVGSGLQPRRTAEEVAAGARLHLDATAKASGRNDSPDIISVTAVHETDINRVFPNIESGTEDRVVWIVKARGWYVAMTGPPGRPHDTGPEGYLMYDDATGALVGMGIGSNY